MKILDTIKNGYETIKFAAKAHSPEILVGTAIVAGVVGIGLLIKASFESKEIIDEAKDDLENLEDSHEIEVIDDEEYEKIKKEIIFKTAVLVTKKYIAPAALIITSAGCFLGSNKILTKRNVSLTAAYATLNGLFKDYRKGVVEKYGEEEDYMLYHGIKKETITEKTLDENGNEVEKEKTIYKKTKNNDFFTLIVDSSLSKVWDKNPMYTLNNLISGQDIATRLLWARGHLFLNDVLDILGADRLPADIGYRYGWRYYKDGNNPFGDNFVSFGVDAAKGYVTDMSSLNRFLEGDEENVILTFNCDGPIADFMKPADYQFGNYATKKEA